MCYTYEEFKKLGFTLSSNKKFTEDKYNTVVDKVNELKEKLRLVERNKHLANLSVYNPYPVGKAIRCSTPLITSATKDVDYTLLIAEINKLANSILTVAKDRYVIPFVMHLLGAEKNFTVIECQINNEENIFLITVCIKRQKRMSFFEHPIHFDLSNLI